MRKSDGSCAGAGTKVLKGLNEVAMAEASGLLEALNWVENQQLHNVIFESDSATVVKAIQSKTFPRNAWGQVARNCARVYDRNESFSINWVSREGNKTAHALARCALVEPDKSWPCGPSCIWTHIQKDMGFVSSHFEF
jgi:ribonuclease HI